MQKENANNPKEIIVYAVRTQLTWTHLRSLMFNEKQ